MSCEKVGNLPRKAKFPGNLFFVFVPVRVFPRVCWPAVYFSSSWELFDGV